MEQTRFERLAPRTPNYAELPVLDGFNWVDCLADVEAGRRYLVVFRSVRRETADPVRLKAFDDLAYEEAAERPGLLVYFRGCLNANHECLSFCLWESQEQAEAATRLPLHRAAADLTDEMYASFELERWILTKCGETSNIYIEPAQLA